MTDALQNSYATLEQKVEQIGPRKYQRSMELRLR